MKTVYYSEILDNYFASEEECKLAERKYREAKRKENQEKKIREEEMSKLEAAYQHVLEVEKQADQMVNEAEEEYEKIFTAFIEKYGFDCLLKDCKEEAIKEAINTTPDSNLKKGDIDGDRIKSLTEEEEEELKDLIAIANLLGIGIIVNS